MDRIRELRALHLEFLILYLGHSLCRQMAGAARSVHAQIPESLTWLIENSGGQYRDWLVHAGLIIDAVAYNYDSIADDYFQQMETNQAHVHHVTALAESEQTTLMEAAQHNDDPHNNASDNTHDQNADQDNDRELPGGN